MPLCQLAGNSLRGIGTNVVPPANLATGWAGGLEAGPLVIASLRRDVWIFSKKIFSRKMTDC